MKRLIMLAMLMIAIVGISGVAATPFSVDKYAEVSGDWVWDGTAWDDRTGKWNEPVTATYNFAAESKFATDAIYTETETLGTPWEYSLDSFTGANSKGWTHSLFSARTVNDPVEYPIVLVTALNENAYTTFKFDSESFGDFGHSTLSVSGNGYVSVEVRTNFKDAFSQWNHVRVNK